MKKGIASILISFIFYALYTVVGFEVVIVCQLSIIILDTGLVADKTEIK